MQILSALKIPSLESKPSNSFFNVIYMLPIDQAGSAPLFSTRMRYPFEAMHIGDSLLIEEYKKAESARVAALLFVKRKNLNWKFGIRKQKEGWRLYRII